MHFFLSFSSPSASIIRNSDIFVFIEFFCCIVLLHCIAVLYSCIVLFYCIVVLCKTRSTYCVGILVTGI